MAFQLLGAALLVLLRVAPSLLLVPVFGGVFLRPLVRVAMALALALSLATGALAWPRAVPTDGWFAVLAGRELTLGVALALVLSAPFHAVRYAGQMLDRARGQGLAAAEAGPRSIEGPVTSLLQATTVTVFVASGAHRAMLRALAVTWREFPLDASSRAPWRLDVVAPLAARWVARSLESALALAASALLALAVTEVALALLARVSRPVARAGLDLPLRATLSLAVVAMALLAVTEGARPMVEASLAALRDAR
jgi:type III secretory pathway component EscT